MVLNEQGSHNAVQTGKHKLLNTAYLDCIHCGMCLSACPTFTELGLETDSPRGRVYLMRAHDEDRVDITDNYVRHLDLCLGCRACETACPSTVHYGQMLEEARFQIKSDYKKPIIEKLIYDIAFNHFITKQNILALLFWFLYLCQRVGIHWFIKAVRLPKLLPKTVRAMLIILPRLPNPKLRRLLLEVNPPKGEIKHRVALLRGCIADFMFSDVNLATVRVLNINGCEVIVPKDQVCCGALHAHSGYREEAKDLARRNIDAFERADVEAVIVNSAGCGAAMKEYDHLLADDSSYAGRAEVFVKKVKDITEYLVEIEPVPASTPLKKKVVYHDACHLAHGQQIRKQPRDVLVDLAGVEICPLEEAEFCCGSAGIYNITHYEMAARLLERKVKNILAADGDIVATGNPGCLLQIRAGIHEHRKNLPVVHTVELLDIAYRNGKQE